MINDDRFQRAVVHTILILLGLVMIAPFFWMVSTAFKTQPEIYRYPPTWLPNQFRWENFVKAWNRAPFGRFYLNSVFVTLSITLGQLLTSILAAYVFARINFFGRDYLFLFYLATLIIPIQVRMLPLFLLLNKFGWVDSYQGLIMPFLANAFSVFLLRQFFMTIPKDLEDAARIDGCGYFRFLWKILLPLSKPALATVTLFVFLTHWRDYIWPLVITNSTEMRTLPVGLRYFISATGGEQHLMMAASILVIVPVVLAFVLAQRHFIRGITLTGLK